VGKAKKKEQEEVGKAIGNEFWSGIVTAVTAGAKSKKAKREIFTAIWEALENELDWDTQDEAEGIDPELDAVYNEWKAANPDDEEEEEEESDEDDAGTEEDDDPGIEEDDENEIPDDDDSDEDDSDEEDDEDFDDDDEDEDLDDDDD
jgi:hypothetical protein